MYSLRLENVLLGEPLYCSHIRLSHARTRKKKKEKKAGVDQPKRSLSKLAECEST